MTNDAAKPLAVTSVLPPVPGLEDDAFGAKIVGEELRLLQTVNTALERARTKVDTKTEDDARLLELRNDISTAKPDDLPALFEQMHTLGAVRAQRGKVVAGEIDLRSPYFGHLRLEELYPGEKKPRRRDVLVGPKSYVDPNAGVRIVDWRNAPVSRIFYRYREEDDYEEVFSDAPIEGTVLVRRMVAIVQGKLVRVTAPQGTYVCGDGGVWRKSEGYVSRLRPKEKSADAKVLAAHADAQARSREERILPAIASMLDGPQYELITKEANGLIVIQGSAGSGKTTVGLHRVAYLTTFAPQKFTPEKMMVVVPNEALIHYTARVLPSLGVEGVTIQTFTKFATRAVLTLFPNLPTRTSGETPSIVSRLKSSGAMLRGIDILAGRIEESITERIAEGMSKWPGGELVSKAWEKTRAPEAKDGGREVHVAVGQRVSTLVLWLSGRKEIAGVEKAIAMQETTRGTAERILQGAGALCRNVTGVWDELVTSRDLLEKMFGVGSEGATSIGTSVGTGQLNQFNEWCVRQSRVRSEGERDGEEPSIDAEDLAILLRAWQRLRGPIVDAAGEPLRLAHLLVDEVQDSNPIELRVLFDTVMPDHPITLAGDVAQRMLEDDDDRGEFDWPALLADMGMKSHAVEPLKVSYRSTAEITNFSRGVLGPLSHDSEPIATRSGPPVELFSFSSIGESVSFLADALRQLHSEAPDANVAVIARFPQHAQVFYEGLERAEVQNVRRVARQNFSWEAGFDVTDIRQTKGLEFDEVILVETTANVYPDSPQARHALYVGATRAAHQLWCMSSQGASKLVEEGLAAQAAGQAR
jgi:DNA helicase II / ATP-dependent DNA helicase PcrA